MVRLIFFVVALLMLIGAVIGGLYFWGIDPLAKLGVTVPMMSKGPEKPPPPPPPSYVDFGLLVVPVVQDREVKKQAEMIVRLVVDAKDKEIVARNLPRLQNAYLADMITFLGMTVHEGQPLDVAGIKRRLTASAARTLEGPYVKDVVIENPNLK